MTRTTLARNRLTEMPERPPTNEATVPPSLEVLLGQTLVLVNRRHALRKQGGNFAELAEIQSKLHAIRAEMASRRDHLSAK